MVAGFITDYNYIVLTVRLFNYLTFHYFMQTVYFERLIDNRCLFKDKAKSKVVVCTCSTELIHFFPG